MHEKSQHGFIKLTRFGILSPFAPSLLSDVTSPDFSIAAGGKQSYHDCSRFIQQNNNTTNNTSQRLLLLLLLLLMLPRLLLCCCCCAAAAAANTKRTRTRTRTRMVMTYPGVAGAKISPARGGLRAGDGPGVREHAGPRTPGPARTGRSQRRRISQPGARAHPLLRR